MSIPAQPTTPRLVFCGEASVEAASNPPGTFLAQAIAGHAGYLWIVWVAPGQRGPDSGRLMYSKMDTTTEVWAIARPVEPHEFRDSFVNAPALVEHLGQLTLAYSDRVSERVTILHWEHSMQRWVRRDSPVAFTAGSRLGLAGFRDTLVCVYRANDMPGHVFCNNTQIQKASTVWSSPRSIMHPTGALDPALYVLHGQLHLLYGADHAEGDIVEQAVFRPETETWERRGRLPGPVSPSGFSVTSSSAAGMAVVAFTARSNEICVCVQTSGGWGEISALNHKPSGSLPPAVAIVGFGIYVAWSERAPEDEEGPGRFSGRKHRLLNVFVLKAGWRISTPAQCWPVSPSPEPTTVPWAAVLAKGYATSTRPSASSCEAESATSTYMGASIQM
ncbi:hypothetical protein QBC46DRAFT_393129 [Diplogelasinospora grovesii]|uniref:Uncharacterized protein n=1 Tax=Diplogelasinospora grovesii TaxID=303347 RepID=A0AAN6N2Y2_9PEZI|nr:hypothetical protein QBC46DRAFT_393129 [Diplogelasinospora grovesii]